MTDDVEDFLRLRREAEQIGQQRARLEGGREQILSRLRNEFNCSSLNELRKLIAKLDRQNEREREESERRKRELVREHRERLKGMCDD